MQKQALLPVTVRSHLLCDLHHTKQGHSPGRAEVRPHHWAFCQCLGLCGEQPLCHPVPPPPQISFPNIFVVLAFLMSNTFHRQALGVEGSCLWTEIFPLVACPATQNLGCSLLQECSTGGGGGGTTAPSSLPHSPCVNGEFLFYFVNLLSSCECHWEQKSRKPSFKCLDVQILLIKAGVS